MSDDEVAARVERKIAEMSERLERRWASLPADYWTKRRAWLLERALRRT